MMYCNYRGSSNQDILVRSASLFRTNSFMWTPITIYALYSNCDNLETVKKEMKGRWKELTKLYTNNIAAMLYSTCFKTVQIRQSVMVITGLKSYFYRCILYLSGEICFAIKASRCYV